MCGVYALLHFLNCICNHFFPAIWGSWRRKYKLRGFPKTTQTEARKARANLKIAFTRAGTHRDVPLMNYVALCMRDRERERVNVCVYVCMCVCVCECVLVCVSARLVNTVTHTWRPPCLCVLLSQDGISRRDFAEAVLSDTRLVRWGILTFKLLAP